MLIERLEARFQFATTLPTSIAGYTFRCVIDSGSGPFAKVGVFDLVPAVSGNNYQVRNVVGVADSSGTYFYQRQNKTSGRLIFDDSLVGPGSSLVLHLTGDNVGDYVFADAERTGSSIGTFTLKAPVPTTGELNGFLFTDRNRNGALDRRDIRSANRSVWLDTNADGLLSSGEARTVTVADGSYSFPTLPPGRYRVASNAPTGLLLSTPPQSVRIRAGAQTAGINLGFASASTVSGTVFNDLNGNGRINSGENLLAGYRVYLDTNGNGRFDRRETSALTNTAGIWSLITIASAAPIRVGGTTLVYTASLPAGRNLTGINFARQV